MIKVPTFIIGGFLVLTGLIGYLVQDPGLTLKLKGPLASNASFVLSDGVDKHVLDFIPCPESAGENVWWIAHKLNEDHARVASQKNFATENGANDNDLHSFWYASSRGETMKGLLLESERYNSAGSENQISIDWTKIDVNSSSLRIIYKNIAGNAGPATLTSNNWDNVDLTPLPEAGQELTFSKSWTAFIPGIIGLLLILLAQGAEMAQKARKHIMHVAVLVGLFGFIVSAGKIGTAVAEMNWLKGEPYGIIHASMLKPLSMLLTSGLLFIYVLLCIISFVSARKEMAAKTKSEDDKKKKVLQKVKKKNESVEVEKKQDLNKPTGSSSAKKESLSDSNKKDSGKKEAEPKKQDTKSSISSGGTNREDSKVAKPADAFKTPTKDSPSTPEKDGKNAETIADNSVKKASQDEEKKTKEVDPTIGEKEKVEDGVGKEGTKLGETKTQNKVSSSDNSPLPQKANTSTEDTTKGGAVKVENLIKPSSEIPKSVDVDLEKPGSESEQKDNSVDKKDSRES